MPFLSENVTSTTISRKAGTALSPAHIHIRPLARPLTKYAKDVPMRTTFMPASFRNVADTISRTAVRVDDVWVIGFPNSGDVIVQHLIWRLLHGDDSEIDFRDQTPLLERTAMTHPRLNKTYRPSWEMIERMESPRVLRTNLPLLLLPSAIWRIRPRIVYVSRTAAEVAADYYKEYVHLHGYKGSPIDFAELMTNDLVAYAPYHGHVHDFGELQGVASNIFNVKIQQEEEGKRRTIEELAAFLEISVTEERMNELADWMRTSNEKEESYREDVQAMDGILKRAPTVDLEVGQLPTLAWREGEDSY